MSKETKWTEGPWVVSRTSGLEIFINHEHDRADRAPGYFAEVRRFTSDHEQVEANARLIAAAPELYEALAKLEALGGLEPSFDSSSDHKEFCRAAQAAMAKARGEHD